MEFRAWSNIEEKMFKVCKIDFEFDLAYERLGILDYKAWHMGNLELMQYTGLSDMNGMRIYDGDILLMSPEIRGRRVPMKISWSYIHAGWFWNECGGDSDFFGKHISESSEIVGNIYENPEMWKMVE